MPRMADVDASTDELRAAHDVLAEVYAERLAGALDTMPVDQAVLGLFAALVGPGGTVGDIGCGTGRLAPFLAARGLVHAWRRPVAGDDPGRQAGSSGGPVRGG